MEYIVERDGTISLVKKNVVNEPVRLVKRAVDVKAPKLKKNTCKLCGGVVTPSRLRKHLIVQHGFDKTKANRMVGGK